jgi:Glycosyl transferase family 8
LIYLDCDILVFRDLSELFEIELSPGKILAAVPDSETLTLGDDSYTLAGAMRLPADARYFYSGVLLMNLDELRKRHFLERAVEFLNTCSGDYRFHDQSAFNFLLHGRIEELPEHWNRVAWRFDEQDDNSLRCVLHYPSSPPWLGGTPGPAQVLFERFASDAGMPVNRQTAVFRKSRRQRLLRNALAPFRALAFQLASFLYKVAGEKEKCEAYQKVAHYWLYYVLNAPRRLWLHHRRAEQIQSMKFKFAASTSVP